MEFYKFDVECTKRSPGFAVCQHAAGGRVAEAIADLLAVKRRIG
jgi:hypothetical protein